jgi:hypothetical protein
MIIPDRPTLRATPEAWQKLWLYIRLAQGEVGGLASVEGDGDDWLMTDLFLINQRATDIDTEIDPEAASLFLIDYMDRGADPSLLRLWWHSHARESCFWSADDEHTIDNWGGEMLIALEGNKAGKFLCRLDRYEPRRETIGWVDFAPPGPPPADTGPEADEARAELTRHVRVVTRRTNKLWTDVDMPKRGGR